MMHSGYGFEPGNTYEVNRADTTVHTFLVAKNIHALHGFRFFLRYFYRSRSIISTTQLSLGLSTLLMLEEHAHRVVATPNLLGDISNNEPLRT